MSEHLTPLAVARAFLEAWTSRHMDTAAGYVAEDVVFDGPIQHSTGIELYFDGLAPFAQTVTGDKILATFGDDDRALIMHEVSSVPFGTITMAELFTVKDGKIQAHRAAFDTYELRKAAANQAQPLSATD